MALHAKQMSRSTRRRPNPLWVSQRGCVRCLYVEAIDTRRRHGQHAPDPQGRAHRIQRRPPEDLHPQDVRRPEPVLAAAGLAGAAEPVAVVVVALLLATVVQMLLGELVPQNLAISRPLPTARAVVPLLRGFSRVCRPVIALFNDTANMVVRWLGVAPRQELGFLPASGHHPRAR
jgi:hypothetical protein